MSQQNQFAIDLSIEILSHPNLIIDVTVGDHVEDLLAEIVTKFLVDHTKHKLGPHVGPPVCTKCQKPISQWRPWDYCSPKPS